MTTSSANSLNQGHKHLWVLLNNSSQKSNALKAFRDFKEFKGSFDSNKTKLYEKISNFFKNSTEKADVQAYLTAQLSNLKDANAFVRLVTNNQLTEPPPIAIVVNQKAESVLPTPAPQQPAAVIPAAQAPQNAEPAVPAIPSLVPQQPAVVASANQPSQAPQNTPPAISQKSEVVTPLKTATLPLDPNREIKTTHYQDYEKEKEDYLGGFNALSTLLKAPNEITSDFQNYHSSLLNEIELQIVSIQADLIPSNVSFLNNSKFIDYTQTCFSDFETLQNLRQEINRAFFKFKKLRENPQVVEKLGSDVAQNTKPSEAKSVDLKRDLKISPMEEYATSKSKFYDVLQKLSELITNPDLEVPPDLKEYHQKTLAELERNVANVLDDINDVKVETLNSDSFEFYSSVCFSAANKIQSLHADLNIAFLEFQALRDNPEVNSQFSNDVGPIGGAPIISATKPADDKAKPKSSAKIGNVVQPPANQLQPPAQPSGNANNRAPAQPSAEHQSPAQPSDKANNRAPTQPSTKIDTQPQAPAQPSDKANNRAPAQPSAKIDIQPQPPPQPSDKANNRAPTQPSTKIDTQPQAPAQPSDKANNRAPTQPSTKIDTQTQAPAQPSDKANNRAPTQPSTKIDTQTQAPAQPSDKANNRSPAQPSTKIDTQPPANNGNTNTATTNTGGPLVDIPDPLTKADPKSTEVKKSKKAKKTTKTKAEVKPKKKSNIRNKCALFWQKIANWFKRVFGRKPKVKKAPL